MTQSYLKASLSGPNGAGKSGTAARLAIGISKELCNSAPVLVADSEERWRFYEKTMFEPEGVPLIKCSGASLIGVQKAMRQAEQDSGVCCFVGDQLTSPWMAAVKEFSYSNGSMPFERRQQLMNQWEPVVEGFRYGKFHAICCGRLGFWWERLENEETGEKELTQGDAKFNAGGSQNFGYEADLEIQMRRHLRVMSLAKKLVGMKSSMQYIATVLKDAAGGILNGKQFTFDGREGAYRQGDYVEVFESFRPYLQFMATVDAPTKPELSDRQLVISGKTPYDLDQSDRRRLLENISGLFDFCFGSAQSTNGKMFRNLTLEFWGYGWSWSHMEETAFTAKLAEHERFMQKLRVRIEQKECPTDHASCLALLQLVQEEIEHPGKHVSLLEAMGIESIKEAKKRRGPQPIVKLAEAERRDEVATGD